MNWLYVFIGGGLGSVCRYLTANWLNELEFKDFPIGTLGVNLIGSFIIGFVICYLQFNNMLEDKLKYLLVVGFLGGFTTFSSFALENFLLIERKAIKTSLLYISSSLFLGILLAYIGYWLMNRILVSNL
ncbi:MAG: fluoride efflux transporter CrcB [Chitinophagales bacterium]|nr:fluoride efflux transporter CrcB [Chitinophagales bacterium]